LHHRALDAHWTDVRENCHPKETYFDPLVRRNDWQESLGRGRVATLRELAGNWNGLKRRCEEVARLQQDVERWPSTR